MVLDHFDQTFVPVFRWSRVELAPCPQMSAVLVWLVQAATEELALPAAAATARERRGASLALALAGGALLALLLPAYSAPAPPARALPAR